MSVDVKTLIAEIAPGKSVVVSGAQWDLYQEILHEIDERHVFATFTGRRLELMLPSFGHVRAAELLGSLVRVLAKLTGTRFLSAGSTTLQNADLRRGLEPDKAFYFRNTDRMIGRDELDLLADPPPDLAIEIELDRRAVNRMRIYAALGVPEVWRYNGRILQVECLNSVGEFERQRRSPTFPGIAIWQVHHWLQMGLKIADETSWVQAARESLDVSYHAPRPPN